MIREPAPKFQSESKDSRTCSKSSDQMIHNTRSESNDSRTRSEVPTRFEVPIWIKWFAINYPIKYGINFVPIKMNVIFQETYENINWNGIKCLWNWKKKIIACKIFDFVFNTLHVLQWFSPLHSLSCTYKYASRVFIYDSKVFVYDSEVFVRPSGTNLLWGRC